MKTEKTIWKDGAACAVMLSVNLDAEFFGRIFYPGIDVDEGDIRNLGRSGMEFGLPHLLDCFDAYRVKATFFIPGAVGARYPDAVREIAARGHEIGCHGNQHEIFACLGADEQRSALREAIGVLTPLAGEAPVGFRMPEGEITEETLSIVKSMGFLYSSSLSDDDAPYIREPAGLLELPIHWELFDLPCFVFTFDPPIPPGQSRSMEMNHLLRNWLYELEGARRFGTLMNLQLEPLATGEQGRIFMLEELLDEIKRAGDVWLATGREIAEYYLNNTK